MTIDDFGATDAYRNDPNLIAANEHLQRQLTSALNQLQETGALRVRLRDAEQENAELRHANGVLQTEVNRWRAAYPDMTQTTGATT